MCIGVGGVHVYMCVCVIRYTQFMCPQYVLYLNVWVFTMGGCV